MISTYNVMLSINKHLYNSLKVPYGYEVLEATQYELVRSSLDSGNLCITYALGADFFESENHPKKRLNINVFKTNTNQAIIEVERAVSRVIEVLEPLTSFDILDFDNSEVKLTDCVILHKQVQPHYVDADRILIRPIFFAVGYGNVFN